MAEAAARNGAGDTAHITTAAAVGGGGSAASWRAASASPASPAAESASRGAANGAASDAASATAAAAATAQHLLYVLLDSNLPTGGFVASSGLESYAKHGFLRPPPAEPYAEGQAAPVSVEQRAAPSSAAALGPAKAGPALVSFAQAEVDNYAASTGWYVAQAHAAVRAYDGEGLDAGVAALLALDAAHEATLLSHVARRASKAQGIATLSLYFRGLGPPPGFDGEAGAPATRALVDAYRARIRKGLAPGHLAVCWGVMTAALGLDLETSLHLYLFTHTRALLSSAVRLNVIGPYLSTQLLAHPVARLLAGTSGAPPAGPGDAAGDDDWAWADDAEHGPATTWPLGEILAARHDMQHSRIFNS
ncbi:hypothetical protein Q8F55_005547 [Vanrija albida]|uniref:Urease accessory protein UreF n=1 Tax=Vanrija albida TaxID=181172 RepID=A0ABR3Q1X9_9TREE